MTLDELIRDAGLRLLRGGGDRRVTGLTDDSRQVAADHLFIARPGTRVDGRAFIDQALQRGASAVLVQADAPAPDVPEGVALLTAPRVDGGLCSQLAERFYDHPSRKLKLVAVTGTNGKTTLAFIVQHLLRRAGVECGLIGTVLVDDGRTRAPASLTTPSATDLSRLLASMVANGCRAAVMELSSHGLHQGRAAGLDIDVAVFTNLTGDHLDYHGSMDAYADAKAVLFEMLGPGGWAVVNSDDAWAPRMLRDCRARVLRCTLSEAGDLKPGHCRAAVLRAAADHSLVRFEGPFGSYEVRLPLVGRHNVCNALQAVAAANCVTAMARHLRKAVESCPSPPGRLELVTLPAPASAPPLAPSPQPPAPALPTVLVDYAHTHDALQNVLTALRPLVTGRLVTVFGCGGDRDRTKRPKMAAVACAHSDRVVITSDNPRTEDPQVIIDEVLTGVPPASSLEPQAAVTVEPDRAKAIALAIDAAGPDDMVLIAGKGHEDYQIIGTSKRHFDDREEARAALRKRLERAVAVGGRG